MTNSDFGENGLGMRNGHAKLTRASLATSKESARDSAREKASTAKKGRDGRAQVAPHAATHVATHSLSQPAKKSSRSAPRARGVAVDRRFSTAGVNPLDAVVYERRSSVITNPDGSIVFKMDGAEVPTGWSQLATDIVISKYFRRAGLHGDKDKGETSVRQVVRRLAHTIRVAGETGVVQPPSGRARSSYFTSKADAEAFEAELSYLLVNQIGAFNSPVWFNLGLWHEYEIKGSGGNWAWDGADGLVETKTAYERPQCSACFI
jgi:ribonucleoside-diphosphate reductase alpha chain